MKAYKIGFNPEYQEDAPTMEDVQNIDGYAIIEFGTSWCEFCQASQAAAEEVLSALQLPHIKVFDGAGKRLGRQFKVKHWPTLILLKSGEEVARVVRPLAPNDLEALIPPAQV
jgi:thioredoxin 1